MVRLQRPPLTACARRSRGWPQPIAALCLNRGDEALHPFEVTRQHVNFEVHLIVYRQQAQRRYRRGVRDDVEQEIASAITPVAHIVDGQRHAVDRDRAFFGDERGHFGARADRDLPAAAVLPNRRAR